MPDCLWLALWMVTSWVVASAKHTVLLHAGMSRTPPGRLHVGITAVLLMQQGAA